MCTRKIGACIHAEYKITSRATVSPAAESAVTLDTSGCRYVGRDWREKTENAERSKGMRRGKGRRERTTRVIGGGGGWRDRTREVARTAEKMHA